LAANSGITHLANLAPNGSSISLSVPPQSVTLLVVPTAAMPPAPTLTATATSEATVALVWSPVAGAVSYDVQKSVNHSAFGPLVTVNATSYGDGGLTKDTTYLYQVRANVAGGSTAYSATDAATTVMFTDSPLTAG